MVRRPKFNKILPFQDGTESAGFRSREGVSRGSDTLVLASPLGPADHASKHALIQGNLGFVTENGISHLAASDSIWRTFQLNSVFFVLNAFEQKKCCLAGSEGARLQDGREGSGSR